VPRDAQKRFELAEALRLSGNSKSAAIEYLNTTCLDNAYYIAYHQMLKSKPTADQVDEACDRLTKLEEQKPKNLMLRVALSEILEQKGDLYGATRQLVDLQYTENIPTKYQLKINTRVHYLVTKSKDVKTAESAAKSLQQTEEDIDSVPLPLPDSSLDNNLSANKLKDGKIPDGYGHTRLLP
jgi:Flp pilus assembly protein TadD